MHIYMHTSNYLPHLYLFPPTLPFFLFIRTFSETIKEDLGTIETGKKIMGAEKEAGKGEGEKKADAGKDSGKGAGDGALPVVLKIDMHCEGCAKKVKRFVKNNIEGVVEVKADCNSNKLTVVGKVDPTKVQEKVAEKTKKKVELLSPPPKKDAGSGGDKKPEEKKAEEKKADDKKPKEPPVSTVVLKIKLHCDGCIHKIKRVISKVKGVQEVTVDPQKDLVMVKGTMDVKSLTPYLSDRLRRNVDVVPPKKDDGGGGDKKAKDGGDKKDQKEGGGGEKEKKGDGGGDKKKEAGGDGDGDGGKMETSKMEHYGYPYDEGHVYDPGYGHAYYQVQQAYYPPPPPLYQHPQGYPVPYVHPDAPQMFSDENPNACSIM
ncbi:heavy metal-associated isoprenylated plant protein 6 [Malania oleifera]|uniref:heavy metal-associated isoprenylated plant protein 6 n=1 Tax=Malania oleifera TaxID=397392 RepID=UPI0025AE6239|nr:heavy metal-associated isoprenylated plant protein 6 [Malania oleifera]